MGGLRTVPDNENAPVSCGRCSASGCPWDRIGGLPICPDCQEMLIRGEGEPLALAVEPNDCAACQSRGTIPVVTVPLQAKAVVIDLCPAHLRALLRRDLDPVAFLELVRRLEATGLTPDRIFLLHDVFYSRQGRALQPVRIVA